MAAGNKNNQNNGGGASTGEALAQKRVWSDDYDNPIETVKVHPTIKKAIMFCASYIFVTVPFFIFDWYKFEGTNVDQVAAMLTMSCPIMIFVLASMMKTQKVRDDA